MPDGSVWLGCNNGLYRWSAGAERPDHFMVVAGGSWLENFVRCLYRTRAGALWVGTEGGLYSFDPNAKPFRHISGDPTDPQSLSADAVSAVIEAGGGLLWVGTYGGGLNLVDPVSGEARRLCRDDQDPRHCVGSVVWDLHLDDAGLLWIAGSHLWSLDPETMVVDLRSSAFDSEGIFFLAEDRDDAATATTACGWAPRPACCTWCRPLVR
jgi:ligand-binding sensor domain-containing protein